MIRMVRRKGVRRIIIITMKVIIIMRYGQHNAKKISNTNSMEDKMRNGNGSSHGTNMETNWKKTHDKTKHMMKKNTKTKITANNQQ